MKENEDLFLLDMKRCIRVILDVPDKIDANLSAIEDMVDTITDPTPEDKEKLKELFRSLFKYYDEYNDAIETWNEWGDLIRDNPNLWD